MEQESTTPAAPEVATYNTTEDAAQALLARWNSRAEAPTAEADESEAQDVEEQADDDAEQPEQGTAEADVSTQAQSEDDSLEIDVAGEKFKLPKSLSEQAQRIQAKAKEVEAGATRKFQEVAELRKAVEQERELTQLQARLTTQQTDLIADLRSTFREMQQLQGMDIMSLHEQDPVAASRVTARLVQLQSAQQRLQAQLSEGAQQLQQAEAQRRAQQAEQGMATLTKLIPNLTDTTKQELASYIATRPLTPEGKAALWDAEVIAAFHDAKRYRDMMAAKPAVTTKKAQDAPTKTLRPGTAAAPNTSAKQRVEALRQRAAKTGATDDIAAMFMSARSVSR